LELVLGSSKVCILAHLASKVLHQECSNITPFINDTKIRATQNHKTTNVGLNTFTKNVLKFICFVNLLKKDLSHPNVFSLAFSIHHINTANGDTTINIHRYKILINASTHKAIISIANITVVPH
jgi:hypothetical protein